MAKKAKKKAKRARTYEVWVKYRRDGVVKVKAKTPAEAQKLVEERIEDAWDVEDVAEWYDVDPQCDIEIRHITPKTKRRRRR